MFFKLLFSPIVCALTFSGLAWYNLHFAPSFTYFYVMGIWVTWRSLQDDWQWMFDETIYIEA